MKEVTFQELCDIIYEDNSSQRISIITREYGDFRVEYENSYCIVTLEELLKNIYE